MAKSIMKVGNLWEYGIRYEDLIGMGIKQIKIYVSLGDPPDNLFLEFPPKERIKKRNAWRREAFSEVTSKCKLPVLELVGTKMRPVGFVSTIEAKDIEKCSRNKHVSDISLEHVPGLKKRKFKREKKYFNVWAQFIYPIEGQKKGLIQYEDRFVMLRAYSFEDARDRFLRNLEEYESMSMLMSGRQMKEKFKRIVEVYDVDENEMDEKLGMEVYSRFFYKKLKPEDEFSLPNSKN